MAPFNAERLRRIVTFLHAACAMGFMRTAYDAFKFFVALRVQLQGAFGSHAGLLRFRSLCVMAQILCGNWYADTRTAGSVGNIRSWYFCHSIPRARRSNLSVPPGQCHPHARIRATLPDAPTCT